ncbi:MAG: ABC transporter permease, partial [Rhodococcus sp.]|nr:ABC transporter permease [Rhodococcus sp. (in: high G+C Gram-positive bacteria)]
MSSTQADAAAEAGGDPSSTGGGTNPKSKVRPGDRIFRSLSAGSAVFISILIAAIGIANTLSLSINERVRELGLLRAVGMDRKRLKSTIRWEAVMISVLG